MDNTFICDICHRVTPFLLLCKDESVFAEGWVICEPCIPLLQAHQAKTIREVEVRAGMPPLPSPLMLLKRQLCLARLPAFITDENTTKPWPQCYVQFIGNLKSPKTARLYNQILSDFFSDPSRKPDEYVMQDALAYLQRPCRSVRNMGGQPALNTVNGRLTAINSFYSFSAAYTVLDAQRRPYVILKVPSPTLGLKQTTSLPQPRSITDEDLRAFFAQIDTSTPIGVRDYTIFSVFLICGRRRSELLALKWSDIESHTFREKGKPPRQGWRYKFTGKGRHGQFEWREMPATAKEMLDEWKAQLEAVLGKPVKPDDAIFTAVGKWPGADPRHRSGRPLDGGGADYAMHKYMRMAGINPHKYSIHSFRHSCASARYTSDRDILSLADFLGHSNLATTQRYLTGLVAESDRGADAVIARFDFLRR